HAACHLCVCAHGIVVVLSVADASSSWSCSSLFRLFFFTDPAPPEIYTLSLHDALPIFGVDVGRGHLDGCRQVDDHLLLGRRLIEDRKSTRLNSSHLVISYAVFCLKKKKNINRRQY